MPRPCGTLTIRAFEVPLEMREARGMVEVRIAVTNTLLPFYEGQQWDASSHSARGV